MERFLILLRFLGIFIHNWRPFVSNPQKLHRLCLCTVHIFSYVIMPDVTTSYELFFGLIGSLEILMFDIFDTGDIINI